MASTAKVVGVKGREVLDSRGRPTVECELEWEAVGEDGKRQRGGTVRAMVPSGASTGDAEAKELRDGDPKRFAGMGCLKAAANIASPLGQAIAGADPSDQRAIDAALLALDTSEEKDKRGVGANAILAVSMACCRAGAEAKGVPLYKHINALAAAAMGGEAVAPVMPVPCLNVINGGVHAGNMLAFQEFFLIPCGAASFREALQIGAETYQILKKVSSPPLPPARLQTHKHQCACVTFFIGYRN